MRHTECRFRVLTGSPWSGDDVVIRVRSYFRIVSLVSPLRPPPHEYRPTATHTRDSRIQVLVLGRKCQSEDIRLSSKCYIGARNVRNDHLPLGRGTNVLALVRCPDGSPIGGQRDLGTQQVNVWNISRTSRDRHTITRTREPTSVPVRETQRIDA